MKKLITCTLIALFFATTTSNMGCTKSGSGTNPITAIPDVANFLVNATTFVLGQASNITINSSSLGAGTFTVNYSLSGAVNLLNQTASLVMSGGAGTFQTPTISTAGQVTLTVNSISNSAGGSATPSSGNTSVFSDSTGVMTCNINGTAFRAIDVHADLAGSMLTIRCTFWNPLTDIQIVNYHYTHTAGTMTFNQDDSTSFNGAGGYQGPAGAKGAHDGILTITSTSGLITGTFSFNTTDGSHFTSGTFSCPAP